MSELISMSQQFSGLPMEALIGGPLMAAADANGKMAMTQTHFMLDTCFKKIVKDANGNLITDADTDADADAKRTVSYEPIMITMTLSKTVPTRVTADKNADTVEITKTETSFSVPLLTIIPLNSLAVDNVDISFDMEVKSSFAEEQNRESRSKTAAEGSFEGKAGWGPFSVTIRGSVHHESENSSNYKSNYTKSNSAKYGVKVHAAQQPLPDGVGIIIQHYASAISLQEKPTMAPKINPDPDPKK